MDLQIFDDDDSPAARSYTALVRRMANVHWFAPIAHRGKAERVHSALGRHYAINSLAGPKRVRILGPQEGRKWLREQDLDAWNDTAPAEWLDRQLAVAEGSPAAMQRLQASGFMAREGGAWVLHPRLLPVHQELLMARLELPQDSLPFAIRQRLLDRLMQELGTLAALALLGLEEERNPLLPKLALYEEGLYPLDCNAAEALIWAPVLS